MKFTMRPDGRTSMVTGRNGSGKSTIVDALLAAGTQSG